MFIGRRLATFLVVLHEDIGEVLVLCTKLHGLLYQEAGNFIQNYVEFTSPSVFTLSIIKVWVF